MLKKTFLLLLVACCNTVCKGQQYFTGVVEYKIRTGYLKPDTLLIQCEYAPQYAKLIPPAADRSGKEIDEDLVLDWTAGCFYVIKKGGKTILKKSFKEKDSLFRFTREYKYPDSVADIAGIKGSLHNMMLADSTSFDTWLADSLLLPVPATLRNHSDFFIFCQEKLLLKMSLKDIGGTLRIQGRQADITITAENVKYLPANNAPYQLPAGYKVIDEAEQQRISDSLMRAFKAVDSSLSASDKAIELSRDSAIMLMKQTTDSIIEIAKKQLSQKQPEPVNKKKTTGTRQNRPPANPNPSIENHLLNLHYSSTQGNKIKHYLYICH
jgi:hypothetical protein